MFSGPACQQNHFSTPWSAIPQPKQMLPAYDKGDNLHPNDAGYKAMAESIDLNLLTTKP